MKKTVVFILPFLLCSFMACRTPSEDNIAAEMPATQQPLPWLSDWLGAWELVSDSLLQLPRDTAPDMLFFDEQYVYTTSRISLPAGTAFPGPGLFTENLSWWKARHKDSLRLPDRQKVPVQLMTFAAPAPEGRKVFFVMAAPSFWEKAGIKSDAFPLKKMLTGVFLHEFAHTRQFKGFGNLIDSIEKAHPFPGEPMSDDLIQHLYAKNSAYVAAFREEVDLFYKAAFAEQPEDTRRLAKEAIRLYQKRQAAYFGNDKVLITLDNIFLSMEGLGQMVAVLWLTHPKGGNIAYKDAIEGFRRKRNQWSQEEGLAMFLVLQKLGKPNWQEDMFSNRPRFIIDILRQAAGT